MTSKQTLSKYLRKNPVSINEHAWFYHEGSGLTFVHEIMVNGEFIRTDQIEIPWKKVISAVNDYNNAKSKQQLATKEKEI